MGREDSYLIVSELKSKNKPYELCDSDLCFVWKGHKRAVWLRCCLALDAILLLFTLFALSGVCLVLFFFFPF